MVSGPKKWHSVCDEKCSRHKIVSPRWILDGEVFIMIGGKTIDQGQSEENGQCFQCVRRHHRTVLGFAAGRLVYGTVFRLRSRFQGRSLWAIA